MDNYLTPEIAGLTGKNPRTKSESPIICITTAAKVNSVILVHVSGAMGLSAKMRVPVNFQMLRDETFEAEAFGFKIGCVLFHSPVDIGRVVFLPPKSIIHGEFFKN